MRSFLVLAAAVALTACGVPEVPKTDGSKGPVMACATGREFAVLSDKDQDWYLTQGCQVVCPSMRSKHGRRFARRLEIDRISRLKALGCDVGYVGENRLEKELPK